MKRDSNVALIYKIHGNFFFVQSSLAVPYSRTNPALLQPMLVATVAITEKLKTIPQTELNHFKLNISRNMAPYRACLENVCKDVTLRKIV